MSEMLKPRTALLPGSYDPLTRGHLDVIERAARMFDQVVVAVMNNASKTYRFSLDERAHMATLACASYPNVRVVSSEGMLVDLFDQVNADVIVKGVRNERDFVYEQKQADWNRQHNPRALTVYLPAEEPYKDISSTAVREGLLRGVDVAELLPPAVVDYLKERGLWT